MKIISPLVGLLFIFLLMQTSARAEDPVKILILGDSLTAGYGLAENDAFPVQLERALQASGYNVMVINAGVSGDTAAGGLARLDWALSDRPQIVMIELGANDALRGLPPEQTRKNIEEIIIRLKQAEIKVLLTGMRSPRNFGFNHYSKFDQLFPELAENYQVAFYPFFLEGVATKRQYNQSDGLHPNPEGVKVIVQGILPTVEQLLDQLAES